MIAGVGTYRGVLEAVPTESNPGSLNVINALPVEQYVKGVIPNESPPSWPAAELQAQAIESRSFALTAGVGGNGFDLYDDTRSQVYDGLSSETATTNAATEATRGQVVTYGGKIVETYFSACSGGHTESVQNVFVGPAIPYLPGVPDPYDYYCPLHDWTLKFSGPEISAKLGAYLDGKLKQVVITKRGVSPRIIAAKLIGTGGVTTVTRRTARGRARRLQHLDELPEGRRLAGPRQHDRRVDRAVVAAGQVVDAVVGDAEAAVGEHVVDRDRGRQQAVAHRREGRLEALAGDRRRRRRSRDRRGRGTRPGRKSR